MFIFKEEKLWFLSSYPSWLAEGGSTPLDPSRPGSAGAESSSGPRVEAGKRHEPEAYWETMSLHLVPMLQSQDGAWRWSRCCVMSSELKKNTKTRTSSFRHLGSSRAWGPSGSRPGAFLCHPRFPPAEQWEEWQTDAPAPVTWSFGWSSSSWQPLKPLTCRTVLVFKTPQAHLFSYMFRTVLSAWKWKLIFCYTLFEKSLS